MRGLRYSLMTILWIPVLLGIVAGMIGFAAEAGWWFGRRIIIRVYGDS